MADKKDNIGLIKQINILKFRKINNQSLPLSPKITAIIGQNGTMKTTVLGLIAHPFSDENEDHWLSKFETIDGSSFTSKFAEKFNLPVEYENKGDHLYSLQFFDHLGLNDFELTSISRGGNAKNLRLWSTAGKQKGTGYINLPVIYLSLSRTMPVGEIKKYENHQQTLADEEVSFFIHYYQQIMGDVNSEIQNVEIVKSTRKRTLGPSNEKYGSLTMSSGEDSLGKIILAVLSFKRLLDNPDAEYQGGLLVIDELDSTFYPRAQENLIKCLFKFSAYFNIQIVFTTHSFPMIKPLFLKEYRQNSKVVYLKQQDGEVEVFENLNYKQIEAELTVKQINDDDMKIKIYNEDIEARDFIEALLFGSTMFLNRVLIIDADIGCKELLHLCISRKIPEFRSSLILLDADSLNKVKPHDRDKVSDNKNIVFLPSKDDLPPDQLMYFFLNSLREKDSFWPSSNRIGAYSKQMCFADHMGLKSEDAGSRYKFKDWYLKQKINWIKNEINPFAYYLEKNSSAKSAFLKSLKEAYNYIAEQYNYDIIE